jgi:hypothetical protein
MKDTFTPGNLFVKKSSGWVVSPFEMRGLKIGVRPTAVRLRISKMTRNLS